MSMIGVMAEVSQLAVAREFFELFKTPWEPWRPGQRYAVVLCANPAQLPDETAPLTLVYSGRMLATDPAEAVCAPIGRRFVKYRERRIPIYGSLVLFPAADTSSPNPEPDGTPIRRIGRNGGETIRVGYDLFEEVRRLLGAGQPVVHAAVPALDLHIGMLRDLLVEAGVPLVEIPPVPDGYRFTACLTHDVDHPLLRRHAFDHTMFGFLYRALAGSVFRFCRGRVPFRDVLRNWTAALQLPLLHLGLARDIWSEFDRYTTLEGSARSTFFLIPFAGEPGRQRNGPAPGRRAGSYGAAELAGTVRRLLATGCEIGLHGIDAWRDSSRGSAELEEIRRLTKSASTGVRMHWLYFDDDSPAALEKAGAAYDSSVGYNETIGYRAGTGQVYKPLTAGHLLELPLHIMDTALFYPAYLDLSPAEAKRRMGELLQHAVADGGCLTVNWHDRSIAPERLWHGTYVELVREMRENGAWLPTAADAVAWFRLRRAARFEESGGEAGAVRVATDAANPGLPGLRLRRHEGPNRFRDISLPAAGACATSGASLSPDRCFTLS